MTIAPISGAMNVALSGVSSAPSATGVSASNTAGKSQNAGGFAEMLSDALGSVSSAENTADDLVRRLATGEDVQLHQVSIATTEAALAVETLVAFRDQAISAYNQIVNMQL
ncbi:MAG: flagellar hook-basal body complex protein FliE [Candidatus Poriferisodalaceae bacterium]|jgi:flagellar hook-basal body complex protein FliE